jgi:hypothetical protein
MDCASFAYGSGQRMGVWGGLTERERRRARAVDVTLRADPDLAARRIVPAVLSERGRIAAHKVSGPPARCDTLPDYLRHRRVGETPCDACVDALRTVDREGKGRSAA